jgi:hypothetical protein
MRIIDYVLTLESMYSDNYYDEILDSDLKDKIIAVAKIMNQSIENDEIIKIIKEFKARNPIKVYDGAILRDDYNHKDWYEKSNSEFFWNDYSKYLRNDKKFKSSIIDNLENNFVNKIMNCLGNPNENVNFFRRGLVIGDVQSGKTSAYTGLICKAADLGYKVIILLTGQTEILRSQTQKRIDEAFVGIDTSRDTKDIERISYIGVGKIRHEVKVNSFTSVNEDFVGNKNNNVMSLSETKPTIFVLKKNGTVLYRLYKWLLIYNSSSSNKKINLPAIIIDDEADNASINTNKIELDPTMINRSIRNLSKLFSKSNYIGITATPFANVFINPEKNEIYEEDLFPENFIYLLNPPSNYIGPESIFGDGAKYKESIINLEISKENLDLDHKKDWLPKKIDPTLNEAIISFVLSSIIRKIRNGESNMSMLVNVSRFISVQNKYKHLIADYLNELKTSVYSNTNSKNNDLNIKLFEKVYKDNYSNTNDKKESWSNVKKELLKTLNEIQVKIVNSGKSSDSLVYDDKNPVKVIAVGGLALSRGLTLEGLSISYFYRNTKTYDVLMQMGRFFGYRSGYEDLFKIYIGSKSVEWFNSITQGIKELKGEIIRMNKENLTPKDFGLKVKLVSDELEITAKNKMRLATKEQKYITFFGQFFETPFLYSDEKSNNSNIKNIHDLLEKFDNLKRDENNDLVFKNIRKEHIISFIASLNVPLLNYKFDTLQILDFLSTNNSEEILNWDVAIIESSRNKIRKFGKINIRPIDRSYNVNEEEIISISGNNARLGGPTDYLLGIKPHKIIYGEKISVETFLVKGRKPLLIIYPISLKGIKNTRNKTKELNVEKRYKNDLLFGFSIGFPSVDGLKVKKDLYYVNKIYLQKKKEKYLEED